MTREDLKNYKYRKDWIQSQINKYIEQREQAIGLSQYFDGMPKAQNKPNYALEELIKNMGLDIFDSVIKETMRISVEDIEGYGIYVYFDNGDNTILGQYKTEERAKEVLQEIKKCYGSYLQLDGGPAIIQGQVDIQPNIFNIPKVYKMPGK